MALFHIFVKLSLIHITPAFYLVQYVLLVVINEENLASETQIIRQGKRVF